MGRILVYASCSLETETYKCIRQASIYHGTKLKQKFAVRDSVELQFTGFTKKTLKDTMEKCLQPHFCKWWENTIQLPDSVLILHKDRGHHIDSWCGEAISLCKTMPSTRH